tara:strand:+ start:208 stop:762 length:555 start_codon:yes stop_codon:yes gene_type:complete
MELIEIAQLVTGIATLIVASVLIWQMIIQKKSLDIAHNDADANMSLQAMESRSAQQRWFADKVSDEMLERMEKGYEFLTQKEKFLIETNQMNHQSVLATEWRLKRVDRNIGYYKQTIRNFMLLGKYKASRDNFENLHKLRVKTQNAPSKLDSSIGDTKPLVDPNFHKLGEEVFEEFSGKKMELK